MTKKPKQQTLDGGDQAIWTAQPPGAFPGFRVYRNFQDGRGKSIGIIIGKDNHYWLWKSVDRKRHFHRNHRSWAIASSLVAELHKEKVDGIILHIREEGEVYCTMDDMDKKSLIDQFPPYEEQHFLHEYYWKPWSVV